MTKNKENQVIVKIQPSPWGTKYLNDKKAVQSTCLRGINSTAENPLYPTIQVNIQIYCKYLLKN